MNPRTHLTLLPPVPGGTTPAPPSHRTRAGRPPGGRAAGVAALTAGLTVGLALTAIATLTTHPGQYASLLLPVAGAGAITLAAAFRSRAVAQRGRTRSGRGRTAARRRTVRPRPLLVHDVFRPVIVGSGSVAAPTRRAA